MELFETRFPSTSCSLFGERRNSTPAAWSSSGNAERWPQCSASSPPRWGTAAQRCPVGPGEHRGLSTAAVPRWVSRHRVCCATARGFGRSRRAVPWLLGMFRWCHWRPRPGECRRRSRTLSRDAASMTVAARAMAPSRTARSAPGPAQCAANSGWWLTAGSESMPR